MWPPFSILALPIPYASMDSAKNTTVETKTQIAILFPKDIFTWQDTNDLRAKSKLIGFAHITYI